jgi:voltage-gated potassium channel
MGGSGSSDTWHRLRWVALLLLGVMAYGTVGFMVVERWSFADSLFMTVVTLSTVGFQEVRPLTGAGEIFTITLIGLGVGIALVAISLIAQLVAEAEVTDRRGRKKMQRRIEGMRDHYIVCAYGRVGRAVARELEAAGVEFVVIDPLETVQERMIADGVAYMTEDPSLEPVLSKAGVERARGLFCAVDSDATNVYITLMARSLNPDIMIVARASEPGSAARLERAGANRVVSPFVSSGRHMAIMGLRPEVLDALDSGSRALSSMEVEERLVDENSPFTGRSLSDVDIGAPVLALRRADGSVIPNPSGDQRLGVGDVVLVLGAASAAP